MLNQAKMTGWLFIIQEVNICFNYYYREIYNFGKKMKIINSRNFDKIDSVF